MRVIEALNDPSKGPRHVSSFGCGGSFNASITVTTDYSYAGISNTQFGPAFQANIDCRTPDLIEGFSAWLFLSGFGTNISFPLTGPGVEIDISAGAKIKLFEKLSADVGYVRYTYPGVPTSFSYDYGEIVANLRYDFELFEIKVRLRYSPKCGRHARYKTPWARHDLETEGR